jgi:Ca-activated chloride channel family protein
MIQPPTSDQQTLVATVESLITGRWTAIGSAILKSLAAIAEIDESVAPLVNDASPGIEPTPVPSGVYAPSIIVLLTDGASNRGPLPLDAAQQAVDRGVRVYTIGYGTEAGGPLDCGQTFPRGGWFGGGGSFRRGIDEPTLIKIAEMTGGTYYSAESADELQEVFQSLPTYLITKQETTEITVAFTAVGALLVALAMILASFWHPLP